MEKTAKETRAELNKVIQKNETEHVRALVREKRKSKVVTVEQERNGQKVDGLVEDYEPNAEE